MSKKIILVFLSTENPPYRKLPTQNTFSSFHKLWKSEEKKIRLNQYKTPKQNVIPSKLQAKHNRRIRSIIRIVT